MTNRNSIWVDGPRPELVPLDIVNVPPVTHLASHPHVSTGELKPTTHFPLTAVGYDMEGVLLRFGETEVSDEVMSWLDDEQRTYNVGRFVLTACRDYEKVREWIKQIQQVGMRVYHPHETKLNPVSGISETRVNKELRKPEPRLYLKAADQLGFLPRHAAFVGDKLSDAKGAMAAGYSASILTPRFGEADHIGDKYVTRRKQIKFMNDNGLEFPELEDVA